MTRARGHEFLAACNAAHARNKELEGIREKGADVILAVFRMLKNGLVHDVENNAVRGAIAETHRTLVDFAQTAGGYVAMTFVDDTIFVCGQLLRASRSIYESATEVGRLLAVVGVSELTFTIELAVEDLKQLCRAFAAANRDPQQRHALLNEKFSHITVRKVSSGLTADDDIHNTPAMERTLQAYAASLLAMREFFEKVSSGHIALPHRVKRVAQRLVQLAHEGELAMLAMTSLANTHRDDAGRAVQSAILVVLMARKLTRERSVLAQLAMTALIADIGRIRVAGRDGLERYVQLGDDAERAVPTLTCALSIASGGVNIQNALRTVLAYEVGQLERQALLGPPYVGAMSPLLQAKILHTARALLDKIAPRDGRAPLAPSEALARLADEPAVDTTCYRFLVQSLGLFPTGTVVEFETGEWGIVLGPSAQEGAVSKPRVKLLVDRHGAVMSRPQQIDLGDPKEAGRFPAIIGVVEPSRVHFNVTSALVESEHDDRSIKSRLAP